MTSENRHSATTEEVRRAIQNSSESLRTLAARYNINIKTVQKWRKRSGSTCDAPRGPKRVSPSSLNDVEQSIIVTFRRNSMLPLDDCLYALQATIPHLSRSSLHRCFQRYGVSQLKARPQSPPKELGHLYIYTAVVPTEQSNGILFMAFDPFSKLIFGHLFEQVNEVNAARFVDRLASALPYQIHTIAGARPYHVRTVAAAQMSSLSAFPPAGQQAFRLFDEACARHGITHSLTAQNPQPEASYAALAGAKPQHYEYATLQQAQARLKNFIVKYNFGRRMKTLRGHTSHEFICEAWRANARGFKVDPCHHMLGLDIDSGKIGVGLA